MIKEATENKIVLAWKPAKKSFEAAIARDDFNAKLDMANHPSFDEIVITGQVPEITFAEMSEREAEYLAKNWRELFSSDRITLHLIYRGNWWACIENRTC